MAPHPHSVTMAGRWRPYPLRVLGMALVWLGLNGGDGRSWLVGVPAVLVAAWVSVQWLPADRWRWSLRGALAFAAYFLRESVRGGWDVARRALAPRLELSPAIVGHSFRLPPGPARLFFCGVVSLLPGTAVVAIGEGGMRVHVLDEASPVAAELGELERRVAALFGLELITGKGRVP